MVKVKVSELTGPALDWAVAKCEGVHSLPDFKVQYACRDFHFSTDWSQGGPIIEREGIASRKSNEKWYAMLSVDLGDSERAQWSQYTFKGVPSSASTSRRCRFEGSTPLIAAMRCYAARKLGEEVEIPGELL